MIRLIYNVIGNYGCLCTGKVKNSTFCSYWDWSLVPIWIPELTQFWILGRFYFVKKYSVSIKLTMFENDHIKRCKFKISILFKVFLDLNPQFQLTIWKKYDNTLHLKIYQSYLLPRWKLFTNAAGQILTENKTF